MNTIAANLGFTRAIEKHLRENVSLDDLAADGGLRGFSACRPRQWMRHAHADCRCGSWQFRGAHDTFYVSKKDRVLGALHPQLALTHHCSFPA